MNAVVAVGRNREAGPLVNDYHRGLVRVLPGGENGNLRVERLGLGLACQGGYDLGEQDDGLRVVPVDRVDYTAEVRDDAACGPAPGDVVGAQVDEDDVRLGRADPGAVSPV